MKNLIIYGTNYLSLLKLINAINNASKTPEFKIIGFINDLAEYKNKKIESYPILGGKEIIPKLVKNKNNYFFHNINSTINNRKKIANILNNNHCQIASLIHPNIDMSYVKYEPGCIIPSESVLDYKIKIGKFFTCRMHVTISHHVNIGNFVYIAPSVTIGGNCVIKEGVFLGIGSTIMSGITIGKGSVIGAGAVVINDIPDFSVAVGIPAKVIKKIDYNYQGNSM